MRQLASGNRHFPRALSLLVALLGLALTTAAQSTIPYADEPPVIDGDGREWPGSQIIAFTQNNPSPNAANKAEVQLSWDSDNLYLYVRVLDHKVLGLSAKDDRLYLNDAVELYLDPRDDSRDRMDINDYQFIVDHRGKSAVLKGEKNLILDSSVTAPKDYGIATLAYEAAAQSLPDGYAVELLVPLKGLGVRPQAGMPLKIDVCIDDVDSLIDLEAWPDTVRLPLFHASNWDGYMDFSFPDHWRSFTLTGGPSAATMIARWVAAHWYWLVAALVALAVAVVWQARRIRQLRDVLPRRDVSARGLAVLAAVPAESVVQAPLPQVPEPEDTDEGNAPIPIRKAGELHPVVAAARAHVLAHLGDDLKMEDLARVCAVSLRSLQRIFKEEMDMSPGNFVVALKMERAAELLRSGSLNVSEAAWQLGYTDSSYFSRVFKKYHGVTPSALAG